MRRLVLKRSQYRILLIIIVIGIILTIFESTGLFDPIKKGVQQVTVPIQITLFQIRQNIKNTSATISGIGDIRSQNALLSEENALLKAENERFSKLEEENKTLRRQLGAVPSKKQNLIIAKTIGFSPLASRRLLLIDKGEIDGVGKGMVVVVKNILIGQVHEVAPRSSSVQLVADPDTKIPAITNKKVRGVVEGQFGAEINLTNVVQGDTLNVGDLVLTTGEGNFPAALVIGEIKEVKKVEKELFQKAIVSPLLRPEELTTVFVLAEK